MTRANSVPTVDEDEPEPEQRRRLSVTPLLSAALCYVADIDPVTFDPTGDFLDATWPWSESFPTGEHDDPVYNIDRALEVLQAARARLVYNQTLDRFAPKDS